MSTLINTIDEVSWHRNGIGGEGFHAIRFHADLKSTSEEEAKVWNLDPGAGKENAHWLAIVFDTPGQCAVICLDLIETRGVRFGGNSWRGDHYETELRAAIETTPSSGSARVGPFGTPT